MNCSGTSAARRPTWPWDVRGSIPTTVCVTEGRTHEVNWLDHLAFEANAIYIMDRGCLDFARRYAIEQAQAFFVIRAKDRLNYYRLHSHPVVTTTGLRSDQTISLTGFYPAQAYPDKLRRVRFYDVEQERALVFLTNHFSLPALTGSRLYCLRWRVELFFKWIKQHLDQGVLWHVAQRGAHAIVDRGERLRAGGDHPKATQN